MGKKYRDEFSNRDGSANKDEASFRDRNEFTSDLSHTFNSAIEMMELSQSERANPNKDINSCFQTIGISLVFIMLATLPPFSSASASAPYSIIGITFGLIGSSAIVGCLFVLDDTIIHADLRLVNISTILMMIAQYGLLFEYLLDSPAAEYVFILLRAIFFAIFFGSLTSCFARTGFLFPSLAVQLCARLPAFLTCYVLIIQSVSIMMHYGVLDPFLGSELITVISGILGSITGVFMAMVFSRIPHWAHRGFRPFHVINKFFRGFIHKKTNRGSRHE